MEASSPSLTLFSPFLAKTLADRTYRPIVIPIFLYDVKHSGQESVGEAIPSLQSVLCSDCVPVNEQAEIHAR